MTRYMRQPRLSLMAASLVAGSCALAGPAHAAQSCAPREVVVARLAETYGESRRSVGLGPNVMVEVFASDETGTWTITVTSPDGVTCLVASGTAFETMADMLPTAGSPT